MNKNLEGQPCWPAQKTTLLQRIIYRLYKKYVGKVFIPYGLTVTFCRNYQKIHPRYKQITHITFKEDNDTANEYYYFNDFGNTFVEQEPDLLERNIKNEG